MIVKELEISMWEAAKNRDANTFLKVVDENAIMICGGLYGRSLKLGGS